MQQPAFTAWADQVAAELAARGGSETPSDADLWLMLYDEKLVPADAAVRLIYGAWKDEVDAQLRQRIGLPYDELDDWNWFAAHEAGLAPAAAVEDRLTNARSQYRL